MNAHKRARAMIDEALAAAHAVAMAEVERMARAALRNPSSGAASFCMAMGSASFHRADGEPIMHPGRYPNWARPIRHFLEDYSQPLGLYGTPLRIDGADAPALTDW